LVELLVVIAIIGILIFLLLPAVNAARDAARRITCVNKVKQVALAVINYEAARGRLPSAGQVDENQRASIALGSFTPQRGKAIGWIVEILPYMEESQLFEDFDMNRSVFDQPKNPQAVSLPSLRCPSDENGGQWFDNPKFTQGKRFAKGNYAAFVSPVHIDLLDEWQGALGGGRWISDGNRIGQKLKEVSDGTSKVMMISEVRQFDDERDQRGAWALPWNGSSVLALDVHHNPDSNRIYEPWDETFETAQTPNHVGANVDIIYDCVDPVGADQVRMPCDTYQRGGNSFYLSSAPRSSHAGGVVYANMDGSVGFLVDSVDPATMAYSICINDGESHEITNSQ